LLEDIPFVAGWGLGVTRIVTVAAGAWKESVVGGLDSVAAGIGIELGVTRTVTVAAGDVEESVVGGLDIGATGVLVAEGAIGVTVAVDREERLDVDELLGVPNGTAANEDCVVIDGVLPGIIVLVTDARLGLGVGS
jgi:hypothetical protein